MSKAKQKPPFYLVWNPDRGAPTKRQESLSVATAEARRLASQSTGTFYVLAVVASAELTALETHQFHFDRKAEEARAPLYRNLDDDVPF